MSIASSSNPQTGRRVGWLFTLFTFPWLYVPINRLAHGGIVFKTPLDGLIPLWPVWALPYQLSIIVWVIFLIWAVTKMDYPLLRAFGVSALAIMLTSYVIFLLFPTYVERPILTGNGWDIDLMHTIYNNDRPYNAFPSSHTYLTVLISLFWQRWYPRFWWLWSGFVVIVLLSTLFTRQHYLPDLVGGAALAWLGYRFGLWWVGRKPAGT